MKRLLALAVLAVATNAFAGDAPKAAPNPMLEAAFKDGVGNWTCTGTWNDPAGKTMNVTSKGKITKALGGHQYVGEFNSPKVGEMPAMKTMVEWHYDPITKGLVSIMVCDNGDAARTTSNGMQGQSMIWTGEGTMMGQAMKFRTTQTAKSPKEMTMLHEVETSGNWVKMGEEACKKN
jgi:hypothetical protein